MTERTNELRLTAVDAEKGRSLRGVPWSMLNELTEDTRQKVVRAIQKLSLYEDTGLTPYQLKQVDEEYRRLAKEASELRRKI